MGYMLTVPVINTRCLATSSDGYVQPILVTGATVPRKGKHRFWTQDEFVDQTYFYLSPPLLGTLAVATYRMDGTSPLRIAPPSKNTEDEATTPQIGLHPVQRSTSQIVREEDTVPSNDDAFYQILELLCPRKVTM